MCHLNKAALDLVVKVLLDGEVNKLCVGGKDEPFECRRVELLVAVIYRWYCTDEVHTVDGAALICAKDVAQALVLKFLQGLGLVKWYEGEAIFNTGSDEVLVYA